MAGEHLHLIERLRMHCEFASLAGRTVSALWQLGYTQSLRSISPHFLLSTFLVTPLEGVLSSVWLAIVTERRQLKRLPLESAERPAMNQIHILSVRAGR